MSQHRTGTINSSEMAAFHRVRRTLLLTTFVVCGLVVWQARGQGPRPREWRLSDAHENSIAGLAYAPDGHTLASASRDATVKLWDLATGRIRTTFRGHSGPLSAVAFSPDGKLLAASGQVLVRGDEGRLESGKGSAIRVWDVTTGRERATLEHAWWDVPSLTFSPDGARLAAIGGDSNARIWDVDTGRLRTDFSMPMPVSRMAISGDLKTLAVSSGVQDRPVVLVDIAARKVVKTLAGAEGPIGCLAFSPDGTKLAAGIGARSEGRLLTGHPPVDLPADLRIWDLSQDEPNAGKVIGHLKEPFPVVAFSPDGHRLVAGGGDNMMLKTWDVATGEERSRLNPSNRQVRAVAFSPDGESLAIGGIDSSIAIHEADTGHERSRLSGRSALALVFLPGDRTLAAGLDDGTIALWNVEAGRVRKAFQGPGSPITAMAVSPDGKWLAAGSRWRGNLGIWPLDTDEGPGGPSPGLTGSITTLTFSPDSKTLAVADDDGTVELLRRPLFVSTKPRLKAHSGRVRGLAYSSDGKSLASVGEDGAIRVWDPAEGRERMSLPGRVARQVRSSGLEVIERDGEIAYASRNEVKDRPIPNLSVAFQPDDKTLVVAYEDFVQPAGIAFYDLATGRQREDRKPPREDAGIWGDLAGVVLTPDGKTLAAGGYGTVSLWDVASWTRKTHFRTGGWPPIRAMAVSHDGATLATSTHQVVQLWSLSELLKAEAAR